MGHTKASQLFSQFCAKMTSCVQFCQITSLSEVGGVSKETPMAKLLHEWGIPAEFKCIS